MTKRHLRLQDAIFYLKINPSKSYLLRFDHVSSFDVMDKNTFVNIRWKLFLALITLDCASCRRPESRFNCVWLWFIGHSPVDLGPSCSPPSCTSSWPPPSSTWSSSNTYWARTHIDCHRIKALILFQLCFRFFSNLCHECQSQFFFLVLSKINPPTKIFHLERTKRKLFSLWKAERRKKGERSTENTFASTSSVSLKMSPVNPGGTAVRNAGSWRRWFTLVRILEETRTCCDISDSGKPKFCLRGARAEAWWV